MVRGKLRSSTVEAQSAISELTGINAANFTNQSVTFSSSNSHGLKFRGYIRDGKITNFYPMF